ncbi:3-phytase [Byssothecium circinans]|uniref:3-phytase n=1 Tax=Byssothecium circinans TaxID=147558 RepID=A0A6A5TM48_9PLEO|nr:3-phytase [Byssothecium circinans]
MKLPTAAIPIILTFQNAASAFSLFHPHKAQQPISATDPIIPSIDYITHHLGQLSAYTDLAPSYFNVSHTGLPASCRISQVHLLQRHAERFPHPGDPQDGRNIEAFTEKVYDAVKEGEKFKGELGFLNEWRNMLGGEYLTGIGAMSEITTGLAYRGDEERKPLLRGTSQSRIHNSLMNWAVGFFGPSWRDDARFEGNWTDAFRTVVIREGGAGRAWNNTLAAHHCCTNSERAGVGDIGDDHMWKYASQYLTQATEHLSKHMPKDFDLNIKDVYAMQLLCGYEMQYVGVSDFCSLFTRTEWQGFEQSLDIRFFYNHAFGNPTARAQGVGYVEELLARLKGEYITESDSSVNSSVTQDEENFPLGMKFYADFTHDKMVLGALTALSLDFMREVPDLQTFPPEEGRLFKISKLVPFAARLVTEVIECGERNPEPVKHERIHRYISAYRLEEKSDKHRFVRIRLNGAVVPLSSIRGGKCGGRMDEICRLDRFFESQEQVKEQAKYQEACFGEYEGPKEGQDVDGTVPKI